MSSLILPGSSNSPLFFMEMKVPPWQEYNEWQQVELFFRLSCKGTATLAAAEHHAAEIVKKIGLVDEQFQDLCGLTCSFCTDLCCSRATVWYDFRDLLFFYLSTKTLPGQQITRKMKRDCSQLTKNGCRLERLKRPFICTWYICPDQINIRSGIAWSAKQKLSALLVEIKTEREAMERAFIHAIA